MGSSQSTASSSAEQVKATQHVSTTTTDNIPDGYFGIRVVIYATHKYHPRIDLI